MTSREQAFRRIIRGPAEMQCMDPSYKKIRRCPFSKFITARGPETPAESINRENEARRIRNPLAFILAVILSASWCTGEKPQATHSSSANHYGSIFKSNTLIYILPLTRIYIVPYAEASVDMEGMVQRLVL
jgi:hypothetical protein